MIAGSPTGFFDSVGEPICFDGYLKIPCDANLDLHGNYAVYQVESRGTVPAVSYRYSETGIKLPKGMTGQLLTEFYDAHIIMTVSSDKISSLRPESRIEVIPFIKGENTYHALYAAAEQEKQRRRESRRRGSQ